MFVVLLYCIVLSVYDCLVAQINYYFYYYYYYCYYCQIKPILLRYYIIIKMSNRRSLKLEFVLKRTKLASSSSPLRICTNDVFSFSTTSSNLNCHTIMVAL